MKEDLIPNYLQKSKKAFDDALQIIKTECIYFENDIKLEQMTMEMAHLILLQREYYPRTGFKYVEHEEEKLFERMEYMEKLEKLNFELEAF